MRFNDPNVLKKEIENNPSNYYLIEELGDIYFREKQYKEAVKQYSIACNYNYKLYTNIILKFEKQILKDTAENKNALLALIYFYLEQGCEEEALYELYDLVEDNPRETKAYELIIKVLKKLNRESEAIEFLNKAMREGIYDNFIVDSLKELYLGTGRIIDSIKLLEKATSGEIKNINFLKDLAELYYINNECKRSAAIYKSIVLIHPSTINEAVNHILKIIESKEDDIYYHQILGNFYLRLLKPSEAVDEYKKIFEQGKGDVNLAVENFKKVLEYYPDFVPARFSLANIYARHGSFSEAVMEYNIILKKHPELINDIINGLKEILKNYPKQVLALQTLSNIYWEAEERTKAVYYMKKWLEVSSDGADEIISRCNEYLKEEEGNISVIELLADSYYLTNELKKAKETAEKILKIDQNNLKALKILIEIYRKEDELDKAKELLLKARQVDPVEYMSFLSLKEVKLKILTNKIDLLNKEIEFNKGSYKYFMELGINYYCTGRLIDAIGCFQKCTGDKDLSPVVHYNLGNCFKEYGRFDLSIDQYLTSLKLNEALSEDFSKEVIFKVGMSNEAMGNLEEAKKNYDRVYRFDINYRGITERISNIDKSFTLGLRGKVLAGVFNNLNDNKFIVIYVKNKEEEGYLKRRKKMKNLSFGQDHNDRGVEKLLQGMLQAAEEELLLAEGLSPELTSIKNNLGLVYLMEGDLNKAKSIFEEAIKLNKDLAVLYNNLALAYHISGDYKQAEKLYQFALKQDDQLSIINLNLGDLNFHVGRLSDSLKLWEKAEEETVLPELARRQMLTGELTFF